MKKNSKSYSKIDKIIIKNANDDNIIEDTILCLEGGAFRGVYTSGVLDCLMMHDINIETTIGVSAGALNGVNYVSGNIGRSAMINLKHRHDPNWVGFKAIKENGGIIGFNYVFTELTKELPFNKDRFFSGKQKLIAVATNIRTGKPEYFDNRNSLIFKGVQASASMPFVSTPVKIGDQYYLDGGCATKLPINYALEHGYKKIIFVGTRPSDYRRKTNQTAEFFEKTIYRKYPKFVDSLTKMNERYNEDCDLIDKLVDEGKVFRITPSEPITVSRLEGNMEKLGGLYELGYNDCEKVINDLKKYLEN